MPMKDYELMHGPVPFQSFRKPRRRIRAVYRTLNILAVNRTLNILAVYRTLNILAIYRVLN
jgi:Fe2+ or Zn2+ uptake regulation protein